MHDARNLRTAERYLLTPPLAATFGTAAVAVCDISAKGARFRSDRVIEHGAKAILKIVAEGAPQPVSLEAVIVWTQSDPGSPGNFMSGARTYAPVEEMQSLIQKLQAANRTRRVEELRSTDRFTLSPLLGAEFDGRPVRIENLSARGARIELGVEPLRGSVSALRFRVPSSTIEVDVPAQVMWTGVKAIQDGFALSYRAGLLVNEKPELMRLAIGQLGDAGTATLDTQSLRLKLKILRARARQLAPSYADIEASGIPAEQYLLVQGVREELRMNPDEAMHYYRRARLIINDPSTRAAAPQIVGHPDALAVWEYLDRSIDPTIVGRAFELIR
jgi:hypothetical protein